VVDGRGSGEQPVAAASPRASRPTEPTTAERPETASGPETPRGLPWGWIATGGLVALVVAGVLATRDDPSRRSEPSARPADVSDEPSTRPLARADEPDDEGESGDSTGRPEPDPTSGVAKPPRPRPDDPRTPPPGTPEEIAAVFLRLPVSPSDGPPIGGVGASGIHIDELRMGSEGGSTCSGRTDDFSVAARDRAVVCVRVVHPREKDELQVLWEKHGGSSRRSSMVVLPKHAYRTRGYLKLREEYIGDWTVRILSSDGVELARHEFTVVP